MNKIKCTVGILTFNNGNTIKRTLESIKDFDEVVVCDGGSVDDTLSIAKKYNCKIVMQDEMFKNIDGTISDFSGVRNQLLNTSKYDWFLFIDSDEYFTKAIVGEIRDIVEKEPNKPAAYWVPRKYVINGETIDCATTYPNKQMRFFNKKVVGSFIKKVHERIKVNDGVTPLTFKESMMVPMDDTISELREKWNYYIDLEQKRRGDIRLRDWLKIAFGNFKVSVLYTLRFLKNLIFCRGKRMPFIYEMERHMYNIKLTKKLFKNIKF